MSRDELDLGRAALQRNQLDDARRAAASLLERNPADPAALALLGDIEQRAGRLPEALAAWTDALEARPDWIAGLLRTASLLAALGHLAGAARHFQRVLDLEPGNTEALYKLGRVFQLSHQPAEAAAALSRTVVAKPDHLIAWLDLGDARASLGERQQAAECFHKALELEPGNPRAVSSLSWLLELEGRYEDAQALLQPLMRSPDTRRVCSVAWARLQKQLGDDAAAGATLMELLNEPRADQDQLMRAQFLMGDLCDRAGDWEEAFGHYARANRMKAVRHDPGAHSRYVDGLMAFFTRSRMRALPRSGAGGDRPVFIVGLPRSGTSLTEQILAGYPEVFGGGESRGMYLVERDLEGYPEILERIEPERLDELASAYLGSFGRLAPGVRRITDKFTTNFLALGLIEMLFPECRVVHCTRNLLDTAVSCYFQDFLGEGLAWSYDLENIARYFVDYVRLMEHWQSVLGIPVLELNYESLTRDPETTSRALVEFAGLQWDPHCLEFHRQPRVVNTASYAQVREPIYTRSVGRHRHYAKALQPVERILRESGIA